MGSDVHRKHVVRSPCVICETPSQNSPRNDKVIKISVAPHPTAEVQYGMADLIQKAAERLLGSYEDGCAKSMSHYILEI